MPSKLEFLELYETPAALFLLGTDQQRVRMDGWLRRWSSIEEAVDRGKIDLTAFTGSTGPGRPRALTNSTSALKPNHPSPQIHAQHTYHVLRMDRRVAVGPRTSLSAVVSLVRMRGMDGRRDRCYQSMHASSIDVHPHNGPPPHDRSTPHQTHANSNINEH